MNEWSRTITCYRNMKEGINMVQQVSDSELELMKIVWANGGCVLYA